MVVTAEVITDNVMSSNFLNTLYVINLKFYLVSKFVNWIKCRTPKALF